MNEESTLSAFLRVGSTDHPVIEDHDGSNGKFPRRQTLVGHDQGLSHPALVIFLSHGPPMMPPKPRH